MSTLSEARSESIELEDKYKSMTTTPSGPARKAYLKIKEECQVEYFCIDGSIGGCSMRFCSLLLDCRFIVSVDNSQDQKSDNNESSVTHRSQQLR